MGIPESGGMHAYLIILHATGSVNQNDIKVIVPSYSLISTPDHDPADGA